MTPHGVCAARSRPQEDPEPGTTTRPTQEPRTITNTSTTTKNQSNKEEPRTKTTTKNQDNNQEQTPITNTNNQGTNDKNQPQITTRAGIPMPSGGRVCRGGTGHAA